MPICSTPRSSLPPRAPLSARRAAPSISESVKTSDRLYGDLRSTRMAPPVTTLLVIVIGRARARARARADERALSAPKQSACAGADGRSHSDALGGFLLARFGIA